MGDSLGVVEAHAIARPPAEADADVEGQRSRGYRYPLSLPVAWPASRPTCLTDRPFSAFSHVGLSR